VVPGPQGGRPGPERNDRGIQVGKEDRDGVGRDAGAGSGPPGVGRDLRAALEAERQAYREIHDEARAVLETVGVETRSARIVEILEGTGLAGYDAGTARIHLLPDLIDRCLASAPRTFPGDEGMNTLGIGGIPPFLYRASDPYPLSASYEDLERIVGRVGKNLDVVRFLSQPVKVVKGDPLRCNRIMDRLRDCIKVTCSAYIRDPDAVRWFSGRQDWHDSICGVNSPLTAMDGMMESLVRSAAAGNLLRLTTMPLAGRTAPQTPEGCMVLTHAEILFMLAVAQTVRPGVVCIHGGMPCVTRPDGRLAYAEDGMNLLNAAVARLNLWATGLPAVQSGGSTDRSAPGPEALRDGIRGRGILCSFGVHCARHCFGVLDNLNFFSEEAFEQDCEAHRQFLRELPEHGEPRPLLLPRDPRALEVIERVGSRDYAGDLHTTANLTAFHDWARRLREAGGLPAGEEGFDPRLEPAGGALGDSG